MQAQCELTWEAVNDVILSGTAILGRDSRLARRVQRNIVWAWPSFAKLASEGRRANFRFVPCGDRTVEFSVRLNDGGRFRLPTARVEAR